MDKKIIILFFTFFLNINLCISQPLDNFGFALSLMENEDYQEAIVEFERFIFFNKEKKDIVYYNIGLCYFRLNQWGKAIDTWKKLEKTSPTEYNITITYFKGGKYESALKNLNGIDDKRANFMQGVCLVKLGKIKEAKKKFLDFANKYRNENKLKEKANKMAKIIDEIFQVKKKSPFFCSFLSSVIPGLGQIYCKRYADGFFSLFLNSGLGYATYRAFEDESTTRKVIFLPLTVIFYTGNIYGGYGAAMNYNSNKRNEKLEKIEKVIPYDWLLEIKY